jgi:hypothetical protein
MDCARRSYALWHFNTPYCEKFFSSYIYIFTFDILQTSVQFVYTRRRYIMVWRCPSVRAGVRTGGRASVRLSVRLLTFSCQRNPSYSFWPDFDASWLNMKIMICRCAWSRDFTVQRFLQELWPLTLSANYTFLGKSCERNFSYIYEPISMQVYSKWRSWCVVMHEVAIVWFNDFCESYGPWHFFSFFFIIINKLYIARVNCVNLNSSYGRILPRLQSSCSFLFGCTN